MSRAYVVYFLMFAAFAAGMWVILTLGRAARAPDDMSGKWTLQWEGPALQHDATSMQIAQSGRFWSVQIGQQRPISMVLREDWRGAADGRTLQMHLDGKVWQLDVTGDIPLKQTWRVPEVRLQLTGPSSHYVAVARRAGVEGNVAMANAR